MNILIISRSYLPASGGIEVFLDNLVKSLVIGNNKIFVFTRAISEVSNYESKENIEIKRSEYFKNTKNLIIDFCKFIKNKKMDITIFCEPRTEETLLALISKIKYRKKTILILTGTMSERSRKRDKIFAGLVADKITAISNYARKVFGYFTKKIKVIYLGNRFDDSITEGISKRENIVLCVGRVDPRKCYETLIESIPLVNSQIDGIKFVIVGNTIIYQDYFNKLEGMVKSHNINNLEFIGEITDEKLVSIYSKAKIFVLPSVHEMFGLVLIEAMNFGLPVIASNVTAIPEVVTEDVGILVKPKNEKMLSEKIIYLLRHPDVLEKMSRVAKERVKLFTWEKMYKEYKEVLFS